MDDRVLAAMQRWPDVPAAYGWLRLDRRGHWYLIDRNLPGFDPDLHGQGSLLEHQTLIDFISRNYSHDGNGNWYWQNGPQRAFADLDTAPLIARVSGDASHGDKLHLLTHTGVLIEQVERACVGRDGVLYLLTEHGPASVHDLDLASLDLTETSLRLHGTKLELDVLSDDADQVLGFNRKPRD